MADFMKKVTKLALKSAAVCVGVAASAALLHKYVKIQSNYNRLRFHDEQGV